MLKSLRRWFGTVVGPRDSMPRREPGRSRFLAAKFKETLTPGIFRPGRRELGYRLYLPSGSAQRDTMPLVVMLHGCNQDPLSFAAGTRMNVLAEEYGCAVLYPEQNSTSNPLRCWNWFESASLAGQGEAALIARLIEQVARRRPIDPQRVYVAGMSAGGAMACVLAVRHSRLFAACASHSGLMYGAASSPAQALAAMRSGATPAAIDKARQQVCAIEDYAAAVPTLVIHGDRDLTVNPLNADQIIEQWTAHAAACAPPGTAPPVRAEERRLEQGGRSYLQQDSRQQGRLVLRKIMVEGLGHAWSGGDERYEFNDPSGPEASRLILDFLMRHQRQMTPELARAPAAQAHG